ncbi:stage II sporulation protein R [Syntrophomonas palmitatica]|uniref:stage II sporulation protein R n=1 Tax=Syntrophomonas palmitatica TaxID=402877 RepID=UPI0006CF5743|nr:stage II sporulation protein R [Syntrophomonas palmitatica]
MKRYVPVAILILVLLLAGTYSLYEYEKSQSLADGVLRLHVIANSDSPGDQALKLAIKDRIVEEMRPDFSKAHDAAEARQMAIREKDRIQAVAETVMQAEGYDYPVNVYIGEFNFPAKSYGNLVLPQGNYQAVRVVLGEGQGKNWWCVLFPPLCMVASSDRGLSLASSREARVSFKCLELLPRGMKVKISRH